MSGTSRVWLDSPNTANLPNPLMVSLSNHLTPSFDRLRMSGDNHIINPSFHHKTVVPAKAGIQNPR